MAIRQIQVVTSREVPDELEKAVRKLGVIDTWRMVDSEHGQTRVSVLALIENTQAVIDILQSNLGKDVRIVIQEVEATVPAPEEPKKEELNGENAKCLKSSGMSREELYEQVVEGTKLTKNFILLVLLSTLVAAMGILNHNLPVLIGAMLIAPLLGPNLAVALGALLGNYKLVFNAIKTGFIGISIAIIFSFVLGIFWFHLGGIPTMQEHLHVGFDSIFLALASGAAAVLTLLSGKSGSLVGVMVSVALLPPASEIGLGFSMGNYPFALNSALLLAVNIVSIILAANITFILYGVRASLWHEKQQARRANKVLIFGLFSLLIVLVLMLFLRMKFIA